MKKQLASIRAEIDSLDQKVVETAQCPAPRSPSRSVN